MGICGQNQRLVDLFDEVTCQRCRDRFYIVRMAMESPASSLEELMRRERDKHRLSVELTALGMLVDNHRDEFATLVELAETIRGDNE